MATNVEQYKQGYAVAQERVLHFMPHMTMGEILEQGSSFAAGYSEATQRWEKVVETGQQLSVYWEGYFSAKKNKPVPVGQVKEKLAADGTLDEQIVNACTKVFRNAWKFRLKEIAGKQQKIAAKKARKKSAKHTSSKIQPNGVSWSDLKKGVQA